MVGFIPEPSIEEDPSQVSKLKIFEDSIDLLDPKPNDLSIADSFVDFDSLKEWFEDSTKLEMIGLEESEFGGIEKSMEIGKENNFGKNHVVDSSVNGSKPDVDGFKPIVCGSELVGGELGCSVNVEEEDSKPEGNLNSSIEEEIGKVSLVGAIESVSSSSEESEAESSSSSSSSCCSINDDDDDDDDDDEEEEEEEEEGKKIKEKLKAEIKREPDAACGPEEGEIGGIEEMAVGGTGNLGEEEEEGGETEESLSGFGIEFDEVDDEDDAGATKGPIRSKNELEVLPPVPPLDVTLQPHHQMLPVGVVLSIIGAKVIVEGREQHNPLNEGSILWITIDRSPLGLVDEIFGPVKNPYYVVRYNSESEVPAGIHEDALISFVPEFANHVLNDKNLYKKGYDASGENDEELSDDGEFSDDEKEGEYKKMRKMTKRGENDRRAGNWKSNKKKVRSKNGAWKNERSSAQQTSTAVVPPSQNRLNFSTVSASLDNHNRSTSGSGFVPSFSVTPQSSGFITPSNGVWTNRMPGQQPQNAIFPNRFSAEGMPLLSQNYQQQSIPLPTQAISMPAMMPYQLQPLDPSLSALPNVVLPGGQTNLFAGPACVPWLGIAGQNGISPTTFGVGVQGQQFLGALQAILSNGPTANGNCDLQPKGIQGNFETSQNFNMGASSRGKKPYHRGRGRGRFTGGKGHQQY